MAGKALLTIATSTAVGDFDVTTNNGTWYQTPCQSGWATSTAHTETEVSIRCRKDATVRKTAVRVTTNARATNTTVRFRKNGSNGNQAITIAGGATGWFEDASNEDSLVDGDTFCYQITTLGSGGQIIIIKLVAEIESDSGNAHTYIGQSNTPHSSTTNTTQLLSLSGAGVTTSTVTSAIQSVMPEFPCAGVLSNLQVYVTANSRTVDSTLSIAVNNTSGNQTLTIPFGVTGFFEDTSNTDTVAVGDFVAAVLTLTSGGGTLTLRQFSALFVGSSDEAPLMGSRTVNAVNGTFFKAVTGVNIINTATEGETQIRMPFAATLAGMRTRSESGTGGKSAVSRINGADGNQTASTASTSNVVLSDTVNTDSVVAGDLVNIKITHGGTANTNWSSMAIRNAAATPAATAKRIVNVFAA